MFCYLFHHFQSHKPIIYACFPQDRFDAVATNSVQSNAQIQMYRFGMGEGGYGVFGICYQTTVNKLVIR